MSIADRAAIWTIWIAAVVLAAAVYLDQPAVHVIVSSDQTACEVRDE